MKLATETTRSADSDFSCAKEKFSEEKGGENSSKESSAPPTDVEGSADPFLTLNTTFDPPSAKFPSLGVREKRNSAKRKQRDMNDPLHRLSTSTSMIADELVTLAAKSTEEPKPKQPIGRPRKVCLEPPPPKRPVGRPRLHPAKVVDPAKPKRVAKGDKPLGRPRTRHLQPPVEPGPKRPRGRPRKEETDLLMARALLAVGRRPVLVTSGSSSMGSTFGTGAGSESMTGSTLAATAGVDSSSAAGGKSSNSPNMSLRSGSSLVSTPSPLAISASTPMGCAEIGVGVSVADGSGMWATMPSSHLDETKVSDTAASSSSAAEASLLNSISAGQVRRLASSPLVTIATGTAAAVPVLASSSGSTVSSRSKSELDDSL